jgi:hypothetical protein
MLKLREAMQLHMEYIVKNEQRPFRHFDFRSFEVNGELYKPKDGTIRNIFKELRDQGKIELCFRDINAFYSLPGKNFKKNRLMTSDHMDVFSYNDNKYDLNRLLRKYPLFDMIKNIPFGKRNIHDIHLSFKAKGLWEFLANIEYFRKRINSKNKSIGFGYYKIEQYLTIRIKVQHTDTVNVIIKCSDNPIILDFDGIMRLTESLTRIEERLTAILNTSDNKTFNSEYNPSDIKIPNKDDWTITLWHLNRDSEEEYSGKQFHCSWRIAKNLFIRIYSKELKLKNKKNNWIIREEIQENPGILFKNILVEFIRNDDYKRLI